MMGRVRFYGVLIVAIFSSIAFAQRLPQGKYHTNRERSYDLIHYKVEIEFDFDNKKVIGKSSIKLAPLRRIDKFTLDAIHLNIASVMDQNSNKPLKFESYDNSLEVFLVEEKSAQDTFTVSVSYDCQPKGGMYFRPDPNDASLYFVSTYGEDGLHANWLPIYNDVNDKFSTEMVVSVPELYVVVSNGVLVENDSPRNGKRVFHWLHKQPHPNYLISIYVGSFEKGDLPKAFGEIPLSYWVPKGTLKQGEYVFRNTTRMVEHFSELFDYRYPWGKYDQVAVPDYAIGAMEHTGVTGHRAALLRDKSAPEEFEPNFNDYYSNWSAEALISHELAHHWFGNNLTCRNLSYIWLNESFASYLMMLWDEESVSRDQLLFEVQLAKKQYFNYVKRTHLIRPLEYHYFDNSGMIYNTEHTYLKGAVVLHMLRYVLGDNDFFHALSYYLHKHEFSNVVSEDLKIAIEEATGENLDWFFEQWVTGGGHPKFEVSYRYLAGNKLIDLSVKQVQPIVEGQDIFSLPVNVTIATPSKTWQERLWLESESESFLLSSEEKPLMVSFDGEGDLVAEIAFPKNVDELVYQAKHDAVAGRMWAIRELAAHFPVDERTVKAFSDLIRSNDFWSLRAEATLQLGALRTPEAAAAVEQALRSTDYRVRKAAVLGLPKFGAEYAERELKNVIKRDKHNDVVATAIVALARANPKQNAEFIKRQLSRESWYDEIKVACLRAFTYFEDAELVPTIKEYTADRYNQAVVAAALAAWEAADSNDPVLHRTLIGLVQSPVYALQQQAIGTLGRLHVSTATAALNAVVQQNADKNLTVPAEGALANIRRVEGQE